MSSITVAATEGMLADLKLLDDNTLSDDLGFIVFGESERWQDVPQGKRASTRTMHQTEWQKVEGILCEGLERASERVELKRTIDFPYRDACPKGCTCRGQKHLNLGSNSLLERAWVFQIDHSNVRLILHGHTFQLWSDRKEEDPQNRADKITSINWRLALCSDGVWKSDPYGETVLPVDMNLRYKWKDILRKKGSNREEITWRWRKNDSSEDSIPVTDRKMTASWKEYMKIKTLLQIADLYWADVRETHTKWQTDRLVRSHVNTDAGDVFTPTRKPNRGDTPHAPSTTINWADLHVAALCIGLSRYQQLAKLPNALKDAKDFEKAVNSLPNCRAELLDDVKNSTDLVKRIKKFLQNLQPSPPNVVLITYSGHGGEQKGSICLIPCEVNPCDEEVLDIEFVSLLQILELCRDFLDQPARDKAGAREVTFVILLDSCRQEIRSTWMQSALSENKKAPMLYTVYSSCRTGGEAGDGMPGGNSPFATELLDLERGIFTKGKALTRGLEEAAHEVQRKTNQKPMQEGAANFSCNLCLYPDVVCMQKRLAQEEKAACEERSSTTLEGDLWIFWCSFKDTEKTELVEGTRRFRGETVEICKGKSLIRADTVLNSPFLYDTKVSSQHMELKCCPMSGQYVLRNFKPTMGTWMKIVAPVILEVGMRFKVGTDMIREGTSSTKVKGFKFKEFWASCFKVISSQENR